MATRRAPFVDSATLSRLSGAWDTAAMRIASRFCHSSSKSWRSRTSAPRPWSPLAPRAAIWASEPAASELSAHWAAARFAQPDRSMALVLYRKLVHGLD